MIVYGLFSETSIGRLFIAGIFPGVLLCFLFIMCIYIWAKINPSIGPRGPKATWREKFVSITGLWTVILLAGLVLGGIWGGIFTPVEAGGIGAFGALIIGLVRRRLSIKKFIASVRGTIEISGMMLIILIGSLLLNFFLASTGLTKLLADGVISLPISPQAVLIVLLAFYLIGGCLMDVLGLMLLTLPIFIPIINGVGIDLILFGVLSTITVEMALITPPIGMNVFILAGMARDIPMYTIFRGILPFLVCMIVCMVLIIVFPQIALFLPETMIK
jgi:tripartite ATP-independent transporter DctM subunit